MQTLDQLSAAFDDFAKASGTFGTRGYDAVKAMIDQLRTGQLVAVADDAIERYRHVKRGTVYEVVGEAELQMNADNLVDGSQMMVYRGEDGRLWCRHYDEFHDGRFASLAAKGTGDE